MNETLIDLSNERRNKYIEILSRKLNSDFPGEKLENGDAIYDVEVQGTTFTCCYSDDEIKAMIGYSVDILEELRKINDNGFDKESRNKVIKEIGNLFQDDDLNDIFKVSELYNKYKTDRLSKIIDEEIPNTCRVGGAWWIILARPTIINTLDAVYEVMVDKFDDEELFISSCYFVLRVIMHSHSVDKTVYHEVQKDDKTDSRG